MWGSDVAFRPASAQLRIGNGVERASRYLFAETKRTEAGGELASSFTSEGKRKNMTRVEIASGGAVGDTASEDAGLSRPSARQDA